MSVSASAAAWNQSDFIETPQSGKIYPYNQEKVELAYINAKLNSELVENERKCCPQIKLNIPSKYENCYKAGIYHNVSLRLLVEDTHLEYRLDDALSTEEISVLHSTNVTTEFDKFMSDSNLYSLEYYIQNKSKATRVIKLFIQALEEYPEDMEDINYLINRYIELIEADRRITDLDKEFVYSSLSTAAYSVSYWQRTASGSKL